MLDNVRRALLTDPRPFRKIINSSDFKRHFGGEAAVLRTRNALKSKPNMKWKNAAVAKDHPLIEFLKLKTFSVNCSFEDDEVLSNDFLDLIEHRLKIVVPFVQLINEVNLARFCWYNEPTLRVLTTRAGLADDRRRAHRRGR